MLKYAREKYSNEKIVYDHLDIDEDVSAFLKKHGAFQRVYSFKTLQWSQDLSCALRNIAELLVPSGECLLFFYARTFLMESFKQMSRLEPWSKYADVLLRGVPKSHEIIDQKGQHAYLSSALSSAGLIPCTAEVLVNPHMMWKPGASYEGLFHIANPAFSLLSEREKPAFLEALSTHLPDSDACPVGSADFPCCDHLFGSLDTGSRISPSVSGPGTCLTACWNVAVLFRESADICSPNHQLSMSGGAQRDAAGVAAGVAAEGRGPFYNNMDAAPTANTTATPCVQPVNSHNDTPVTTAALDLDELSSASEDEGAVLETTSTSSPGPASDTDANWKLAISRRQRQRQKKFEQARAASLQPTGPASTPPSHVAAGAAPAGDAPAAPADAACVAPAPTSPHVAEPRQLRRKPPPLPRTDIKIIMRPKKGLAIRNFTTHQISRAVAGKAYGFNTYVAAPEGTLRGVIHGIDPGRTPEELTSNLRVRTQGVTVHSARMLGATKAAVITFEGPLLPRYVLYYGEEVACHPYKPTRQACQVCLQPGHRSDVCPAPNARVCRQCGTLNPVDGVLSEAEGPATTTTSSTRSNHPCSWAQPPSQRTHSTTQMVQQGERDFTQPLSLKASSKPANKPNYNHPSAGTNNKSTEYEHLLAENVKLKQELAAVRARQARDSAQLHALVARLGSPFDSPEHPSLTTPDRQKTSEIAISVPTATGTAVTREEIREMLSTLNQQLSQQFSTVFTQFEERLDSLETRLESQIAEIGGGTRRKRATRSSRSVTEPDTHRLSLESHASELFSTPASTLGTLTLTPTSASQADIPTPTPFHTTN
ncbi:hypothetical protein HPB52_000690 [Rhipicephalus sanguineus]|uniref:Uncharacterized protein n=1 Tax=Rhipicephalus sanguineus TaxID=34632 RepID=A0A9D4PJC7_RHISA|nr:hypothetical protein HPB52_000690 [Rhipicephalus sanguineus]